MINIKDAPYSAIGDGAHPTEDTAAVVAAMAAMQTNSTDRGGTLYFPSGIYNIDMEMAWQCYQPQLVHNIHILGDGNKNTTLDFANAGGGAHGISFDNGAHFSVKNLRIRNAPAHGLYIGKGLAGTANYAIRGVLEDLRLQWSGSDALHMTNTWGVSGKDIWCWDSTGNGFVCDGFHTTLAFSNIYASDNTVGFIINGVNYSTFNTIASDSNSQEGYKLSNLINVVFNGIGGEQNARDMIKLYASTASTTNIPTANQDIHGVVFTGLSGYLNSFGNSGTYATLLKADSADGRPIEFKVTGASGTPNGTSDHAFIFNSTSGRITFQKELVDTSQFTAADSQSLSGGAVLTINNMKTDGSVSFGGSVSASSLEVTGSPSLSNGIRLAAAGVMDMVGNGHTISVWEGLAGAGDWPQFTNAVSSPNTVPSAVVMQAKGGSSSIIFNIVPKGDNGFVQMNPGTAAGRALVVKGAASQTGNLMEFQNNSNTVLGFVDANGSLVCGSAALSTSATTGFLYLPTCAGTPTGTPTAHTGTVPFVYDTTNNKICVYNGGAWKKTVALT